MRVFKCLQRCGQGIHSLGCDNVSLGIWFQRFCDNIRNVWKEGTKTVSNYWVFQYLLS